NLPHVAPLFEVGLEVFISYVARLLGEHFFHLALFFSVLVAAKKAAEMGGAQPEQISGNGVALVVLDDLADIALPPEVHNVGAIHVDLAGNSTGRGDLMKGSCRPSPVAQGILEVQVEVTALAEVIDAMPGLIRALAKLGEAETVHYSALCENYDVRTNRI